LQAANAFYQEIRATFEWYSEVVYSVSQNAVQDLNHAFSHQWFGQFQNYILISISYRMSKITTTY
jgi:hypothetical protein